MRNMKTEWNLSVMYQGLDDPAYEADVKAFEEVVKATAEVIEKAKTLGAVKKWKLCFFRKKKYMIIT